VTIKFKRFCPAVQGQTSWHSTPTWTDRLVGFILQFVKVNLSAIRPESDFVCVSECELNMTIKFKGC